MCLASGGHVVIKQYIKSKMSTRADRKMKREVRGRRCTPAQQCSTPAAEELVTARILGSFSQHLASSDNTSPARVQVRLMYCMRGQEGVAQILGDFETAAHFHIVVVGSCH